MNLEHSVIYAARKTLTITVERDRSVVVRAPHGTPQEKIDAIVEQNAITEAIKIGRIGMRRKNLEALLRLGVTENLKAVLMMRLTRQHIYLWIITF